MQLLTTNLRAVRTVARGVLFLAAGSATVLAQNTASLSGRVSDAATGRSLHGAIVRVIDTSLIDYTDADGRFSLSDVPTGPQQLAVDYVGLDAVVTRFESAAGQSQILEIPLKSNVIELDEYTVSEQAEGQARAINQQKTASGIVNIVSEEVFGAVLDGNVGQALQRLPGISVDEDQDGSQGSINIRGISGEFNSVQVDGNRVPSSGESRSFNPRQMAADGVTNIEVIKAPTPDRDGDAIGGIVNLVTRSAFQRDGRSMKLKLSGVLNDEPNKWGHAASLSYSDIFSVGGGTKNLGISLNLSSHKTDRYSINADQDWILVTPANNPQLNLGGYNQPVWFMESTHWEYDTRVTRTNTLSGSIDFRTDEDNSFYLRPLFSRFTRKGVKYETDIDIDTRFQDSPTGRKTYAALTPTYGRGTPGNSGSRGSRGWIGTDDDRTNNLHSLAFGGRHDRSNSLLTYDFFHSRNKQVVDNDTELNMLMEPTSPWLLFEYEIQNPDGYVVVNSLDGLDHTDLSLMSEGELIAGSSVKTEELYSARADWERTFSGERGVFKLKAGARHHHSEQFRDDTYNVYAMDEDFPYASVVTATDDVLLLKPKYYDVHPRNGQELLRTNPGLFELVEDDTLEDSNIADYDAEETTSAAYLMGTYQFGRTTILGGVRMERTEWSNVNKRVSYLGEVATVTPVATGNSHTFWLPGLHFRHELAPNLILRESYNRSYGRARLSELSRGRWVDDEGNIEDGNPDLEPAVSDNFDVQLEYYTAKGGLYSVGVFYKDVKDFTYTQTYDFSLLDSNGVPIPDSEGDFEYERPVNGAGAKNYGLELIARQRLFFLPDPLKGLSVALSATFTESEAEYPNRTDDRDLPLEGFSDFLFTGTLDYTLGKFSARVDYRYRSDYIEGLGDSIATDEFYAAEHRVDAEVAYRLRKGLTFFATGSNLTDQPQVSYSGYRPFVEDASYAGRKFTFGLEYSF